MPILQSPWIPAIPAILLGVIPLLALMAGQFGIALFLGALVALPIIALTRESSQRTRHPMHSARLPYPHTGQHHQTPGATGAPAGAALGIALIDHGSSHNDWDTCQDHLGTDTCHHTRSANQLLDISYAYLPHNIHHESLYGSLSSWNDSHHISSYDPCDPLDPLNSNCGIDTFSSIDNDW